MKNYIFHLFDINTQKAQYWLIEGATKANTPIEALKKWYQLMNEQSGGFKNFCYEVVDVQFMPDMGTNRIK
jgi:hypothetical protein